MVTYKIVHFYYRTIFDIWQTIFAKTIDGNIDKDDRDQATVPRSIQVKLHVLQLPQCHLHILHSHHQTSKIINLNIEYGIGDVGEQSNPWLP